MQCSIITSRVMNCSPIANLQMNKLKNLTFYVAFIILYTLNHFELFHLHFHPSKFSISYRPAAKITGEIRYICGRF